MSNIALREEALRLRKENKSYSQIKKELNVPKSTLSYWLRGLPLSRRVINQLRGNNEMRIEKFRETMRQKQLAKLAAVFRNEKRNILPLTRKELLIAGLALYWGEGSKADIYKVALTNTDPQILKFFLFWLATMHGVQKNQVRVALHLYNDMDIKTEIHYWSKTLGIPVTRFIKPYIKKASSYRINHKGAFGHGTCAIMYNNVELKRKILMQIKLLTAQNDSAGT
jgi:hypothetical protein